MTTMYHEIVWNYDESPENLQHAWNIGAQIDVEYNNRGRSQTEYYWEPSVPVQGGGLFTIRRVWTDAQGLSDCINEIIALRESDPILRAVISLPEIHNDDNYNPPA